VTQLAVGGDSPMPLKQMLVVDDDADMIAAQLDPMPT
jgi:hypothetical protein